MSTQNRSARITKLVSALKKHFKPVPAPKNRTLLENLLFACLLENSSYDDAERVFQTLRTDYFDWNELRVSSKHELAEVMKPLHDPEDAAYRFKKSLHAVFESVYAFDIEPLKKQNLGQAIKQLEKYEGTTPFVVAYVTQHGLGGHSIPVNRGLLQALVVMDVISPAEAAQNTVPGLERAVPKSKGIEVASIMHQLGVEIGKNPYGQAARKLLLELDPTCKDRFPKRPAPPDSDGEHPKTTPVAASKAKDRKSVKSSESPRAAVKEKSEAPPSAKKIAAKKPAKRVEPLKKTTAQVKKKSSAKGLAKRKPR
jgi:endonuclease III